MKRRSFISAATILCANAYAGWSQPLVKPAKEKWSMSIGAFGDMDTRLPSLTDEDATRLMKNDINLMNLCLIPKDLRIETETGAEIQHDDFNKMAKYGFTVANLSNEHTSSGTSLGKSKIGQTILHAGMTPIGLENQPYQIFNIRGKSIAIISASVYPGVFLADKSFMTLLRILKTKNNIVIASINAGGTGKKFQHVINEPETYLGKPRGNPVSIAQESIESGADLVLFTGSGTPKGMHIYKNRLIAYGLGQMRPTKDKGLRTLAPAIRIKLNEDGSLISGEITSLLNTESAIIKDDRQEAMKIIQMFSQSDFSRNALKFEKMMFYPNLMIE